MVMGTEKSSILDVIDTTLEPGKHSRYESAETIVNSFSPNTSTTSSKVFTVSSSTIHGSVSIRTIPTTVRRAVDEESTT